MTVTHARSADLNLLTALSVLLEERHVSRAAEQFHLSQSAMSRTLQRLRDTFGDELLVRTANGYELTPRARKIQQELALILPRVNALLRGDEYDPATATDVFNVSGTDYATTMLAMSFFGRVAEIAPQLTINVMPWHDRVREDLELGRLDLTLTGVVPAEPLRHEVLFTEKFVCVVRRDHPAKSAMDLDEYLAARHVLVATLAGKQTLVEDRLHALGHKRDAPLQVPYFSVAIQIAARSSLVATVPHRMMALYQDNPDLRVIAAPEELEPYRYFMAWHPRLDGDIANRWLRDLIRSSVTEVPG